MNKNIASGKRLFLLLAATLAFQTFAEDQPQSRVADWYSQTPETKEDLLQIQNRLEELLPQASEATVAIFVGRGAGSGVIVSADGYILTAGHLINRAGESIEIVLPDGKRVEAKTLGALRFTDAGMAKIEEGGPWPFVPLSESTAKVGDWCFALGHPGGYDKERDVVVRLGRVIQSSTSRSSQLSRSRGKIRSDCKIISGDSGGPLFNLNGEIIGIHSSISENLNENFHVPVEAFQRDREKLVAGIVFPKRTRPAGGFLGVHTRSHPEGVEVEDVVEDSAAAESGIKEADIITRVDGFPMTGDIYEFTMAIGSYRPGEEIKIELKRNGETIELEIKLGARSRF